MVVQKGFCVQQSANANALRNLIENGVLMRSIECMKKQAPIDSISDSDPIHCSNLQ